MSDVTTRPPRDDLFRALFPGISLKHGVESRDGSPDLPPAVVGHFAVFNTWTEIDSWYEGRFLERLAPGAFKKTLKERGDQVRCLFQHGYDPQIGDKPLGPFETLSEDEVGLYYEVPLLDTSYNADLIPGLEAGLYGASFRFRVMREEMVEEPGVSDYNPAGLPERTIKEVSLFEGGPVTFGAYPEATAGMRSVTDEFLVERMASKPERLKQIVEARAKRVVEAAAAPATEERIDSEDVGTLAQMLTLSTCYIEDQDEPDEQGNTAAMQAIQSSLISLMNVEAIEDEPDEPEDEEASAATEGVVRKDTPDDSGDSAPVTVTTPKASKSYLSRTRRVWELP